jgi:uncharacterized protein with gpF-like domain
MIGMHLQLPNFEQFKTSFNAVVANSTAADDAKASTIMSYLDMLIRANSKSGSFSKAELLSKTEALIKEQSPQSESHNESSLGQILLEQLKQRRQTHIDSADHSLSQAILKQQKPLAQLLETLERQAQAEPKTQANSESHTLKAAQEYFMHGINQISQEVAQLEGSSQEKNALHRELSLELAQNLVSEFGSDITQQLVQTTREQSLPAQIYALKAQSKYQIPPFCRLDVSAEDLKLAMEHIATGGENSLSSEKKNQVLKIIEGFYQGKDQSLAYASLDDNQRIYMEHLLTQAENIEKNSTGINALLGKAMESLPSLIMPAVLGAIAGYLMGGMEMLGGIGAVAISVIGGLDGISSDDDPKDKVKQAPPPLYQFKNTTASSTTAATAA